MTSIATVTADQQTLLCLRGIHKHFPGVHALRGVDLDITHGEIHALVGENGAGKSTLMHILAGVYTPEEGTVSFDGVAGVAFADERDARDRGIAVVYQERSLFGPLSIAENIFAGRQPVNLLGISRRTMRRQAKELLNQIGLKASPDTLVEQLSSAEQQQVEIAKALSQNAKLIIFDEPTAALSEAESAALFRVIKSLAQRGVAIIYISHRLHEIFSLANRVTVLKDGQFQGTFPVSQITPHDLVSKMVGRELLYDQPRAQAVAEQPRPVLEVKSLADMGPSKNGPRLRDVSFHVHSGEIVALAGLVGSGRTETALAIFGERAHIAGQILFNCQKLDAASPDKRVKLGIGYVPEDRKDAGLFLDMSIAENMSAAAGDRFGSWLYRFDRQKLAVEELCRKLRVVSRSIHEPVRRLSGGNQQKVLLGRWLLNRPRLLIVDEPTRGVDVGAKAEIHQLLDDIAKQGAAVLVISSDLPEVLALADRIYVMREGAVTGELCRAAAAEEAVMRLASFESEKNRSDILIKKLGAKS